MWARLSTHIGCACAQEAEKDGGGEIFLASTAGCGQNLSH